MAASQNAIATRMPSRFPPGCTGHLWIELSIVLKTGEPLILWACDKNGCGEVRLDVPTLRAITEAWGEAEASDG